MISLFPDQQHLLERIRDSIRAGNKSVLMQAATGSGKTVMAASMIHGTRNKGTKTMMIVPRRELLKQTQKTFEEYEIPYSHCASGNPMNLEAQTFLATSGTLLSRIRRGKPVPDVRMIIPDETHYGGKGLDEIIKFYAAREAWIIGLSATPERLDGKGLGCWYQDMVCGESLSWLIQNGRLSDYRLFSPGAPDLSGIKTVAGDYHRAQLSERMLADRKNIGDAARHYRTHGMGRLNVTYTTSREHNELVCAMFNEQGIPSAVVDGETPEHEMRRIIQAYARREILNLVNCQLLTFGFDLAAASGMDVTIESMTDLQPTQSLALQMQKWGRVLRRKDRPALIFDHASNAFYPNGHPHHGYPDDERLWSLTGHTKKSKDMGDRAQPVKHCPNCFFTHRPAEACPECGYVYEVESRMVDHVDGELVERKRGEVRTLTSEQNIRFQEEVDTAMKRAIAKNPKIPAKRARDWALNQKQKEWGLV